MVFDTSLLAAFDVPNVDPAAQQQAANLLSQQSYQPQSISPPSFSGGGGLAESRPQTVTQGAPYYDPIAIHQGAAPVNYVPYSGPTVDYSNYLTNLFSPSNTGTTNYGPAVGGSGWATSTSDPTSRYGGTNSTDWNVLTEQARPQPGPGPLGGMIANRVAGGIDTLRDIGGTIGDINIPTGWRGQTTIGEQLGNVADVYNTDIPYYSQAMRNTIIPAIESGVNAIAPYTPIAPYQWAANATGLPSAGQIGGWVAPVTAGDVALELIPGVGTIPDFAKVIRRGGGNLVDNLARGFFEETEPGIFMRGGSAPTPEDAARIAANKMTPDAISAISRRLPGGDEKPIFEGIEQAAEAPAPPKPLPGTEAYERGRGTTAPPPDYSQDPGYLESLARMADTGVANPARTKTTAPARRIVTMGDGTAVDATPENIQAATARYLARETTQRKIKADPETFWESAAEQIANAKTLGGRPLMQGVTPDEVKAALLEAGTINKLDVKATPDGKLTVTAKEDLPSAINRANEGDLWSDSPPPPKRPTRSGSGSGGDGNRPLRGSQAKNPLPKLEKAPAESAIENFFAALNLPRTILAGFLDYSYALRHGGLMAISRNKEWRGAFTTGLRSFADNDLATRVMDEIAQVERPGLHISPIEGGKLVDREEGFISRFADVIPGLRQTARANTVFLNKLRADVYDSIVARWPEEARTADRLDRLGKYISQATGRGSLGSAEQAAASLGTIFFSPRYLASLVQAPLTLFRADNRVRYEAAKDLITTIGSTMMLLKLGEESGAFEVEWDPRSSDFAKIKVGNTRLDPWRGYQQIARLFGSIQAGETLSAGGGIYGQKWEDAVVRFLRTKLSPQAGLAVDIWQGEDILGRPVEADLDNALRRVAPLFMQAMWEAIKDGSEEGIGLSALSILGPGTNTYEADAVKLNKKVADMGFTDPTTGEAITEWHKLSNSQKSEAKERDPSITEVSTPSDITQRRNAENQAAWDTLKETGDFDSYFAQHKAIGEKYDKEFEAQTFPDLKNPGEWAKKLDGYYAKLDEITNPTEEKAYREQFVAGLNPAEKEAFESQQSSDPNYRKLQQAMDMLTDKYYAPRDAAFAELQAKVPKLQAFKSYGDVFDNGTEADKNYVGTAMAGPIREILKNDPQADAMRYILGYSSFVMTQQAKAIVDATLAKEGINKKSPNIGRP